MKLIAGLGNPGVRYQNTRHNAGFMVLDRLAEKAGVDISREKFEGRFVKTKIKGEDVILLKPETFMNNSGFSIRAAMDYFKIAPEDLLVIYDDMDTDVGSIRLRQQGSAGGHNGMKSVITCVLSDKFDRIKVGIGRDPKIRIIDYVLTRFREDEKEDLEKAVDKAAQAAWYSIDHSFADTMNRYNVRKKKEKKPAASVLKKAQSNEEEVQTSPAADSVIAKSSAEDSSHE